MQTEHHKTALITGGSSGIGKEFATQLAARGYNLILVARDQEKLHREKTKIEAQYEISVECLSADLALTSGLELVKEKMHTVGHLHCLVNNAGFAVLGDFEEQNIRKYTDMIHVHIIAVLELTHSAIPLMRKAASGMIINVSSVAAFARKGVYAATKQFLVNFTHYLRKQLKDSDIVVQALCPGYTYTKFHQTKEYTSRGIDAYKRYPRFMWMNTKSVVASSLKGIEKNKAIVVPGFFYKLAGFLGRIGILRL